MLYCAYNNMFMLLVIFICFLFLFSPLYTFAVKFHVHSFTEIKQNNLPISDLHVGFFKFIHWVSNFKVGIFNFKVEFLTFKLELPALVLYFLILKLDFPAFFNFYWFPVNNTSGQLQVNSALNSQLYSSKLEVFT